MANDKLELVCVLGSPGSGKGTVYRRNVDEFGCVNLSAGEISRQERAKAHSPYKELIDKTLQ
jgi:UMP-CMP kinase